MDVPNFYLTVGREEEVISEQNRIDVAILGTQIRESHSGENYVLLSQDINSGQSTVPSKNLSAPLMLGGEIRPAVQKVSDLGEIYNLLNHSLAEGTISNYKSVIGKFPKFLAEMNRDIASFSRNDLEMFLGFAGDQNFSYSFWCNIKPALSWLEKILDRIDTVFYGRVLLLIQGGQRFSALQKPPIKKPEIIDSAIIRVLIDKFVFPFLHDIYLINGELFRSVFKEIIKFKTFCRFDCYSKLQAFHFTDRGSHITIYFPGAKNDQHHNGNIAVLDSTDTDYCSVRLNRLYFKRFDYTSVIRELRTKILSIFVSEIETLQE